MANANRILKHPELWIGGKPEAGQRMSSKWDVVVLCAKEHQPSAYAFPDVEVLHCPIDDAELTRDELQRVRRCSKTIAHRLSSGHRVLVTCQMGINRSALVTAMAMKRLTGWPAEKIISTIRLGRKGALSNEHFQGYIKASTLFLSRAA